VSPITEAMIAGQLILLEVPFSVKCLRGIGMLTGISMVVT
jgi:hypothetical protein